MDSHLYNQPLQTPTFLHSSQNENRPPRMDLNIRVQQSIDRVQSDHEASKSVSKQVYSSGFQPFPFPKPQASSARQSNVFKEGRQEKEHDLSSKAQQEAPSHQKIKCQAHKIYGSKETMFVCLEKHCKASPKNNLHNRFLCHECINQQLHKNHMFCTVAKLDQIFCIFHQASLQTVKIVMLKINELRHRFQNFIELFCHKIQDTLIIKTSNPKTNSGRKKLQQGENPLFLPNEKIQKLISQQIFPQLLTQNPVTSIASILKFQEESISEQIENIYSNFQESIKDGMANIQFMNQYKNLIFNPDDMHADEVGLTLDRNKLEAITLATRPEKEQGKSLAKIAFTQTPIQTENPRSFRINGIKDKVIVGCVDSQAHQIISTDLSYENCQHLLMGVAINSKGQITLFNRGEKPACISNIIIKPNDIIELTFHHKQSTLVIIKYSALDDLRRETQPQNDFDGKNASLMGNLNRHVIATLAIESIDEPICYPFAGVSVEGDSVSIVDNILLGNEGLNNQARKVQDSFEEAASNEVKKGVNKVTAFKEKQKVGKKNL